MTAPARLAGPLWLASRSVRRRELLRAAGVVARIEPPTVDDGVLVRGCVTPAEWVMALAYLKARCVADVLGARGQTQGTVLGADTLCVVDDDPLGQPRDAAHAGRMLRRLRGRAHETMTGVCLLTLDGGARRLLIDCAIVRMGDLDDETIDAYLASGDWRGKAGAYNLADRLDAGWDLACEGDPATVMGLPMRRLGPWLRGVAS